MKLLIKLSLALALFCPALVFAAHQAFIEKPDVKAFIEEMTAKHRFNKAKLTALFKTVKLQPQVIENASHPLEKETWGLYQRIFINDNYTIEGAAFRKKYHQSLVRAEEKYKIPGSIIIATLGVETKYGTHPGGFRVIDSLSNLAFTQQRRAAFFRGELEHFLLLTRENHLDPLAVQGSYAGAIGAPQFMPSSYRYYAASFSNKKHIDLIHSIDDSIASIGNYYQKHGWKKPHLVAIPVTVKGKKYLSLQNPDGTPIVFSSADAHQYGLSSQRKIPTGYKVKLIALDGRQGTEYWLTFPDFDVIKSYNASNLYAMAVYQLSQSIVRHKKPSSRGLSAGSRDGNAG